MKNKRRTAAKRWNDAVAVAHEVDDAAAKKALADVLAMSDAEVEAELVREGVDLAKLDGRAAAAFEAFQRGEAKVARDDEGDAWVAKVEPPVVGVGLRRGGMRKGHAIAYAAAAAVATAGVATYLATRPPPESPDVKTPDAGATPTPTPSSVPSVDAKKLRSEALAACARGAFQECLAGLDAAREVDPPGDEAATVQAARKKATDGLVNQETKGKGGP